MKNRLSIKGTLVVVLLVIGILAASRLSAQGPQGQGNLLGLISAKLDQVIAILTAPPPPVDPPAVAPREFYLARGVSLRKDGANATAACAEGFHMASLFEIADPTDLKYDQAREAAVAPVADAGSGPPARARGWVRTGGNARVDDLIGSGNCNAWTSSTAEDFGTVASLEIDTNPTPSWVAATRTCDSVLPVWCVQDR